MKGMRKVTAIWYESLEASTNKQAKGSRASPGQRKAAQAPSARKGRQAVPRAASEIRTAPINHNLPPRTESSGTCEATVGPDELGDALISKIQAIVREKPQLSLDGHFKLAVTEEVIATVNRKCIGGLRIPRMRPGNEESRWDTAMFRYEKLKGGELFDRALVSDMRRAYLHPDPDGDWFNMPRGDFEAECALEDPTNLLESAATSSDHNEPFPYVITPAEEPADREVLCLPPKPFLGCGSRLRLLPKPIEGVTGSYAYLSAKRGSPATLHIEDGLLGSINLVVAGHPKIWLMVAASDREKLETAVQNAFRKTTACSQFVRHKNLVLSPSLLDRWGISYQVVECRAGELVVTLPGAYHQVVNQGPNIAEAVNFALEDNWTSPPSDYVYCSEQDCKDDYQGINQMSLSISTTTHGDASR
ncbi:hypothetical protein W97_09059 [Coniosporium apollinis CBS 100218]|uniref:JmjC domain-containing protein n=1 Tax=Coniosporium apollinis (strain CBS 100218) TaxID=1168221 RepID=R7Z793_CONA1|nr:uncharacterized protein W97_09059 [Coniosporium apollinis CBS 100218]EON69796.1 hypothetical protein W97_09059 [Coniosporium apollinis CBS 100218]